MKEPLILAVESSCDDTSVAVLRGRRLLSCVLNGQRVHEEYGGVVPELASRAHLQQIVPVASVAVRRSGLTLDAVLDELDAVAFTEGPGLVGSLLVGLSFAKGLSLATGAPLIGVNHLSGHMLAPFIWEGDGAPPSIDFPYVTLLVSGGHTMIARVSGFNRVDVLSETIDDAAGEAFDKCAMLLGLGYPGGPVVDRLAAGGDPEAFHFAHPMRGERNFSFSGLKTSFLYLVRDRMASDSHFIERRVNDLCASLQRTVVEILLEKLDRVMRDAGVRRVALGGGVSANSGLRAGAERLAQRRGWELYLPELRFTTDNAAMIGIAGYFKYLAGEFTDPSAAALPRGPAF